MRDTSAAASSAAQPAPGTTSPEGLDRRELNMAWRIRLAELKRADGLSEKEAKDILVDEVAATAEGLNAYWFSTTDMHVLLRDKGEEMHSKCEVVVRESLKLDGPDSHLSRWRNGVLMAIIFGDGTHWVVGFNPWNASMKTACGALLLQDCEQSRAANECREKFKRIILPEVFNSGCCGPDCLRLLFKVLSEIDGSRKSTHSKTKDADPASIVPDDRQGDLHGTAAGRHRHQGVQHCVASFQT